MTGQQIKTFVVERAAEIGFAAARVAAVGPAPHGETFRRWLAAGAHASMDYMARHVDRRCDPTRQWPWAKSIVSLAASYAPATDAPLPVARYARGRDYHRVLKGLCRQLVDDLAGRVDGLRSRICVDTAPVLERDWAATAGVGWVGRNGCLIHPTFGSYIVLAEILLSVELPADQPLNDRCGDCRACVDTCPNAALTGDRLVDARRCISWATIEHRDVLDGTTLDTRGTLFGCDLCQEACPFNRDVPRGRIADLTTPKPVTEADVLSVLGWSFADWDAATRGSATRRAGWTMFVRNAAVAAGQLGLGAARPRLVELASGDEPLVRAAAAWALDRLDVHR